MWRTANMLSDRWALIFSRLLRECAVTAARLANSPCQCGLGLGRPKLTASSLPPHVNDKDEQGNIGRREREKEEKLSKDTKGFNAKARYSKTGWDAIERREGEEDEKVTSGVSLWPANQSIFHLYLNFILPYLPCGPWIVCLILSFLLFSLVWWLILHLCTFCDMMSCFTIMQFHHYPFNSHSSFTSCAK